jgi:hypothetical protein
MTDVYTPLTHRADPTPGARSVVTAYFPSTAGDYLVPIPFKGRLVHCQTSVIIAVGSTNNVTLTLEKDAAGGTEISDAATIAKDSTVGTEDTVTLTTTDPENNLVIDNQDICLAVTGDQTDGLMACFLIFEASVGV